MAAGRQGERQIAAGSKCPRFRCVIVGQHQLLVECLCLLLQAELEICSLLALSEASLARVITASQFPPAEAAAQASSLDERALGESHSRHTASGRSGVTPMLKRSTRC